MVEEHNFGHQLLRVVQLEVFGLFNRLYFDMDAGRFPNGMQRISYDDRSNMYTFHAADGTLWESSSGNAYGELTEVGVRTPTNPEFVIRNP